MEKKEIAELLIQRGYTENGAHLVAQDILTLHPSLMPLWKKWVSDPEICQDFETEGYSIRFFMEKQRMTYPAALLTIDWLLKDPEEAKKAVKRPF